MKGLRRSHYTALAGAAALALLAANWFGGSDPAPTPGALKRPRAAPGAAAAAPARPAQEFATAGLRATDLLGGAALAASPASAASAPTRERAPAADRDAALAALDTRLVAQRVGPGTGAADAFAAKSWFVAPPPAPPQPEAPPPPPPAPQAPPLPFKYMGSLQEPGARTVWYLLQGERLIVAGAGDVIDTLYRTEGAEGGQLRFTYLPLNQRQTIVIGEPQ